MNVRLAIFHLFIWMCVFSYLIDQLPQMVLNIELILHILTIEPAWTCGFLFRKGLHYWSNFFNKQDLFRLPCVNSSRKCCSRSWPILPIFIRFVGIHLYSIFTVFSMPLGPACCLFLLVPTMCILSFIFSAWLRLPILSIFLKDQPLVLFTFFAFNFIDIFVLIIISLTITNEFSYAYFGFKFLFF